MNFSSRLKDLRKLNGLTQIDFSKVLGVSLASIAMWESEQRRPPLKMMMRIAEYFKVSMDYLTGSLGGGEEVLVLPVLAGVKAGFDAGIEEVESGEYQEIPRSVIGARRPSDLIVLRVEGDSMSPKFLDGDRILVQKQPSVDSGDIAVICYDDFENGTIKKVHYESGCDFVDLIPLNPRYTPIRVQDEQLEGMCVIGKVIYLFREI